MSIHNNLLISCRGCFTNLLRELPDYLKYNIEQFQRNILNCAEDEYRWHPLKDDIDPCRLFAEKKATVFNRLIESIRNKTDTFLASNADEPASQLDT